MCYKVECKTCKDRGKRKVYFGETSRNIHVRSSEHYKDCDNVEKNSWMRKHIQSDHGDEKCEFVWNIVKSFQKPMLRQLTEAVYINNTEVDEGLNLKTEYFQNNIKGLKLKQEEYTCRQCSRTFNSKTDFMVHFQAVHSRISCKECDYVSFGNRDLKSHIEMRH